MGRGDLDILTNVDMQLFLETPCDSRQNAGFGDLIRDCATKVRYKSASPEFRQSSTRVPRKSVPQDSATRVCYQSDL